MCTGSIYEKNRVASTEESLELRPIPRYGISGLYPADKAAADQRLVCIRKPTEVTLSVIKIKPDFLHHLTTDMQDLQGKRNVKATFLPMSYNDQFRIGDLMLPMNYLVSGIKVQVGEKPKRITGKKGVDAVKAALTEQDKLGDATSVLKKVVRRARATGKVVEPNEGND